MSDGGPAFPCDTFDPQVRGPEQHQGMSLRDYFAAAAVVGLVPVAHESVYQRQLARGECIRRVSEVAYEIADAMLLERAK